MPPQGESKAIKEIEKWNKILEEKEKDFFVAKCFSNGGRPRFLSEEPERSEHFTQLLDYDERQSIFKHPQLKPKGGV